MKTSDIPSISDQHRVEIEAALFRKLIHHLREHPEVQNIDIMNAAYFCRNCFSKWYLSEAAEHGIELNYDQARELIYGMPYDEYKARYQKEATSEQKDRFQHSRKMATE